jgi:hypothetical protein
MKTSGGRWLTFRTFGVLTSLSLANCLIIILESASVVKAGTEVLVQMLRSGLHWFGESNADDHRSLARFQIEMRGIW